MIRSIRWAAADVDTTASENKDAQASARDKRRRFNDITLSPRTGAVRRRASWQLSTRVQVAAAGHTIWGARVKQLSNSSWGLRSGSPREPQRSAPCLSERFAYHSWNAAIAMITHGNMPIIPPVMLAGILVMNI